MITKPLQLHNIHESLKAKFTEEFGSQLPNVYTSAAKEYEAAKKGVGIFDRSCWDQLMVSGKDSIDLLNRLTTNDLASLRPGMVKSTVFTNEQGRIIDLVTVHRYDDFLLLVTSPQHGEKLSRWIDKFTFSEDVRAEDLSDSMGIITLIGPETHAVLRSIFGDIIHSLERETDRFCQANLTHASDRVLIAPAYEVGNIGMNILSDNAVLPALWSRLLEEGEHSRALPIGWEAFNTLRIERGVPFPGRELREEINPLEANLVNAVSLTKGCYVGQEVIARLDTYKKVRKRLCHVVLEGPLQWSPETSADLFVQHDRIGWITSLAFSPELRTPVALAYIRSPFVQPGLEVTVKANGQETNAQLGRPTGNQD